MARLNPVRLPRLDGRASPEAFGAGRSIESFGGGAGPEAYGAGLINPGAPLPGTWGHDLQKLGQIGEQAAEAILTVQQRDSVITARRNALAAGVEWDKRLLDAKQAAPADAADFTKSFMDGFEQYRRKTIEGLSGTELRIMEDELTQLGGSLYREAVGFESSQRLKAREADAKATVEIARNAVFARPGDHGRILEGLLADIEASDLPEFAKEEMARSTTAAMAGALWSANVQRDPYGARDALMNGDSATLNGLEFGDRTSLLRSAEVEINAREAEQRRRESEARAEQARREAVAREAKRERISSLRDRTRFAVEVLDKGLPVQGLTDLRRGILNEGADAGDILQALDLAEQTADYSRSFAVKPVEDQVAELAALRATPQEPGTFSKLQAASKVLAATTEAVRENRTLVRAGELGIVDLQPVDLTDPDSIAQRVSAAHTAASHMGAPVEMFTPDERADVAKRLAGMPGERKAEYLSQLQAAAGDAYPEVMRDLGLKGGLDRGSRYLSLLAGRPEAARVANAVGEAMDTDEKDLKVNLLRTNWSDADVDREVSKQLKSWVETLGPTYAQGSAGANEMISDVFDMVKRTALVQMRTQAPGEAIKSAADAIINSRYEFRDGYRIPRPSVGGDTAIARFDQMMSDTMAALQPEWLDVPGSLEGVDAATRQQGYYEAVQNRGHWANLPDESGLVLLDELGNAVTARGKPVIVKF